MTEMYASSFGIRWLAALGALLIVAILIACDGGGTATPASTAAPTTAPADTPTATAMLAPSPMPTAPLSPTATPVPPTATPEPTAPPTPAPAEPGPGLSGGQMAVIMLTQEDINTEFPSLPFDPEDSGFTDNAEAAEGTFDPDDTESDIAAAGRITGYSHVFFNPQVLFGGGDGDPLRIETSIYVLKDEDSASEFMAMLAEEPFRFEDTELEEGLTLRSVTPVTPGIALGDESGGYQVELAVSGFDRSYSMDAVFWRRGSAVLFIRRVYVGSPGSEPGPGFWRLASRMDERVGPALAGEITALPSGRATPTPMPTIPPVPTAIPPVPTPAAPSDDHSDLIEGATAITVGETAQGAIDPTFGPSDIDVFAFQAQEGQHYQVDLALGTLSESRIWLYDSAGSMHVAYEDNEGNSQTSRIVWEAQSSGEYYVAVSNYFLDTGSYTLTVTTPPTETPTATPVAEGTPAAQSGNGKYDGDGDGLIEIPNLEQLNAVRYDLNGDGSPDRDSDAVEYAKAFPTGGEAVCNNCNGYELARPLDFREAGSYASGAVNTAWTIGSGWLPIGSSDDLFLAIFDGNGHTLSNLYIRRISSSDWTSSSDVGLFSYIGGPGVIRDLGLLDIGVTGSYAAGGLAAKNSGTISGSQTTGSVSGKEYVGGLTGGNGGTISDSHSAANVSGSKEFPDQFAGGLTGRNGGTISNSYATGNVSGYYYVGGLTGTNVGPSSSISSSYAIGNVTGDDYVGGLAGGNLGTINVSYATGRVSSAGWDGAGGLVGVNRGTINASYSTGSVSAYNDAGGLAGENLGTITASYATGSVSGTGVSLGGEHTSGTGGLVGFNEGIVGASYAKGNVSGDGVTVGGLVGGNPGTIAASYAIGRVASGEYEYVGGLVGSNSGKVTAGFWDTQASGYETGVGDGDPTGVNGKTTAELQAPTGYTGIYSPWAETDDSWDFGTSSQYPALKVDFDGDGAATWQEFGKQVG